MAELHGTLPVHVNVRGHDLLTLWPGDPIPEWAEEYLEPALKGQGDEPAAEISPASSGAQPGATEDELDAMSVLELREWLDAHGVEHHARDRKDDLIDKALDYTAKIHGSAASSAGQEPPK